VRRTVGAVLVVLAACRDGGDAEVAADLEEARARIADLEHQNE
jgi:hypothetical protein